MSDHSRLHGRCLSSRTSAQQIWRSSEVRGDIYRSFGVSQDWLLSLFFPVCAFCSEPGLWNSTPVVEWPRYFKGFYSFLSPSGLGTKLLNALLTPQSRSQKWVFHLTPYWLPRNSPSLTRYFGLLGLRGAFRRTILVQFYLKPYQKSGWASANFSTTDLHRIVACWGLKIVMMWKGLKRTLSFDVWECFNFSRGRSHKCTLTRAITGRCASRQTSLAPSSPIASPPSTSLIIASRLHHHPPSESTQNIF